MIGPPPDPLIPTPSLPEEYVLARHRMIGAGAGEEQAQTAQLTELGYLVGGARHEHYKRWCAEFVQITGSQATPMTLGQFTGFAQAQCQVTPALAEVEFNKTDADGAIIIRLLLF